MATTGCTEERTSTESDLEKTPGTGREALKSAAREKAERKRSELTPWLRGLWGFLRLFAGRQDVEETIETRRMIAARPESCWAAVVFFEEMEGRAPWLLRAVLPGPLGVEGRKSGPGARVNCVYTSGYLTKRILSLEAPRRISFDVVESFLGVEDCVAAIEGSYVIEAVAAGSEIVLSTRYRSALRPRWVFRPLEGMVLHGLHRHILSDVARSACAR